MMISSASPKVDSVPEVTPPGLPPSLPNHLRVGNAVEGIGVTREQVDKGMGESYTFAPFDSLEGHASVIAEHGDIHSMLVGPAENLLLASIFAPLINDRESDDASNAAIEGFVRSVTPEATQWIRASIATALSTHAKMEQTKTFGNHKVVFAHDLYEGHADAGHVTITVTHI